jgi:hypothetical protein
MTASEKPSVLPIEPGVASVQDTTTHGPRLDASSQHGQHEPRGLTPSGSSGTILQAETLGNMLNAAANTAVRSSHVVVPPALDASSQLAQHGSSGLMTNEHKGSDDLQHKSRAELLGRHVVASRQMRLHDSLDLQNDFDELRRDFQALAKKQLSFRDQMKQWMFESRAEMKELRKRWLASEQRTNQIAANLANVQV